VWTVEHEAVGAAIEAAFARVPAGAGGAPGPPADLPRPHPDDQPAILRSLTGRMIASLAGVARGRAPA
jgi:hypothetical protein